MFNRIRYAAHVLSSSPNPYEQADIKFEEERPVETTRVSFAIGSIIEVTVISLVIGAVAPLLVRFWPARTVASANRLTAVVAAVLAMLFFNFFERFKAALGRRLQIADRVAPYFGHKIGNAIKILRS